MTGKPSPTPFLASRVSLVLPTWGRVRMGDDIPAMSPNHGMLKSCHAVRNRWTTSPSSLPGRVCLCHRHFLGPISLVGANERRKYRPNCDDKGRRWNVRCV